MRGSNGIANILNPDQLAPVRSGSTIIAKAYLHEYIKFNEYLILMSYSNQYFPPSCIYSLQRATSIFTITYLYIAS